MAKPDLLTPDRAQNTQALSRLRRDWKMEIDRCLFHLVNLKLQPISGRMNWFNVYSAVYGFDATLLWLAVGVCS